MRRAAINISGMKRLVFPTMMVNRAWKRTVQSMEHANRRVSVMIRRPVSFLLPAARLCTNERRLCGLSVTSLQLSSVSGDDSGGLPVSIVRTNLLAATKYTTMPVIVRKEESALIRNNMPINPSAMNKTPRNVAAVVIPIVAFRERDDPADSIFFVRAAICSHLHTYVIRKRGNWVRDQSVCGRDVWIVCMLGISRKIGAIERCNRDIESVVTSGSSRRGRGRRTEGFFAYINGKENIENIWSERDICPYVAIDRATRAPWYE